MLVSLIVPAYNEAGNLERMVSRTTSVLRERREEFDTQILLVVSDGSTDGTPAIADRLEAEYPEVDVLLRTENPGFGNAIKDGLANADGDVLIPFMADLSDDPRDVPKLVDAIRDGADVAYGSRFVDGGSVDGYPPLKLFYNRAFNNLIRLLFGIRSKDVTNAFTAYRREVIEEVGLESLQSTSFDITAELPLRAHILGFRSTEVPASWRGREAGVSKLNATRKGPLYAKRLLEMFVAGNVLGLKDLFGAITSQSKLRMVGAMAFGLLLLVGLLSLTGLENVVDVVKRAGPTWIALAMVSYTTSFLFRTWRWRVLLRTTGHLADRGGVFRCIMFGWFLNFLLPARIGDLGRGLALKTTEGVPFSVGTGTVVMERVLDMLVLGSSMALIALLYLGGGRTLLLAAGALGIGAVLVTGLTVLYFLPEAVEKRLRALPRVREGLDVLTESIDRAIHNPAALMLSLLISLPVWLFEVGTIFFSARAVGLDVGGVATVVTAITAFVSQSLPLSPAGIGTFEATIAATLSLFGIAGDQSTGLALVDHFARIAVVMILGAISTVHIGFRSRAYFREEVEPLGEANEPTAAAEEDVG